MWETAPAEKSPRELRRESIGTIHQVSLTSAVIPFVSKGFAASRVSMRMKSIAVVSLVSLAVIGCLPAAKRETLPTATPQTLTSELNIEYGTTPEQVLKM